MLYYILQIVAFQVVFLLVYDVFLKRETFFNYNRVYLLGTAILSFILPFIKIDTIKAVVPKDFVVVLPEVIIGNLNPSAELDRQIALQTGIFTEDPTMPVWQIVFWSGLIFTTILFLYKIAKIYWLKSQNPKRWRGNILIVKLLQSNAAFSFFNTVFLGEKISEKEQPVILKHELVHIKQWHSLDLLLFEFMKIVFWFNPLVYMYQNRIKTLHEYIADETAVKQNEKKDYYQQLLNQVFETNNLSFTNTFFKKSLIKKRITMLQKSKSKQIALIKYALLIPLMFGMLIYTSAEVRAQEPDTKTITETIEVQEISEKELIDKYYKQIKAYQEAGEFNKIMELPISDLNKFTMPLDEYARMKAFIMAVHNDRITKKMNKGVAKKSEIERLQRFKLQDKTYAEYLERTKTEKYGRKWESRTEGSTLKLYVKDLKNKTDKEEKRLEKKINLIMEDPFWNELIISDGKQSSRILFHEEDGKVVSVKDVVKGSEANNVTETVEVPYGVIDNVPTFPECKDLQNNKEKKSCTSMSIAKFVNKNFNTELATKLGLAGRQRISVFFKIDKQGNVGSIGARAPHPELEKEAKRVISKLPQFIPGTQKGEPVVVPYSLPIVFQVQGKANDSISAPNYKKFEKTLLEQEGTVGYAVVENVPVFETCKSLTSEEERKKCTAKVISKFVAENFKMDTATKLGLSGRQRISALFTFGSDGTIKDINVRAPHPDLEEETTRVINMLPKFIPGEQKGKKIDVLYSLPITFQVGHAKKTKE